MPNMNDASRGSEPDPPVPAAVSSLTDMTSGEVWKNKLILAAFGVVLGGIAVGLYANEHTFWAAVFGLGAVLFLVLIFSPGSKVATCPYCGHRNAGMLMEDENREVQCENCFEYLVVIKGTVRAMAPDAVSEVPKFVTPLFKDADWPNACAGCGAAPTRLDELRSTSMSALALAAGRVRFMTGTVSGVPYCDLHKDCVTLSVTQDRRLQLKWSSLRMMRRYLALNRSREAMRARR